MLEACSYGSAGYLSRSDNSAEDNNRELWILLFSSLVAVVVVLVVQQRQRQEVLITTSTVALCGLSIDGSPSKSFRILYNKHPSFGTSSSQLHERAPVYVASLAKQQPTLRDRNQRQQ